MRPVLYGMLMLLFINCAARITETPRVPPSSQPTLPTSQPILKEPPVRDLGDGWYEAVGDAYLVNTTPEEARRQALMNARNKVIQYAVGVWVGSVGYSREEYLSTAEREEVRQHIARICEETSAGKIVEEKPPRWETHTVADPKSSFPITVVRAILKAKAAKEEGDVDPDFKVRVALNQDTFRDGEEMTLRIWASKDCYVTVLSMAANDTVYGLLPHKYREDNFISGGGTIEVPNADERVLGLHYRVHLLEGQEAAIERIKVIATKRPYEFAKGLQKAGGISIVATLRGAWIELQQWLAHIPRSERAEAMAVYEIRR